jgi:hypothetical protein
MWGFTSNARSSGSAAAVRPDLTYGMSRTPDGSPAAALCYDCGMDADLAHVRDDEPEFLPEGWAYDLYRDVFRTPDGRIVHAWTPWADFIEQYRAQFGGAPT